MISFSVLFLCVFSFAAAAKLPDEFPRCNRNDPDLNGCISRAVQASITRLVKGVPKLGLLSIDPLRISALDIDQGTGPVAINLKFRDLDIINLSSAKITGIDADINNYKLELNANVQKPLILKGDYEISGKVLVLPITGKGKSFIQLDDVEATLIFQGKEMQKDGRTYMDITNLDFKFTTSKLHVQFDGLFNNDKALGDNMNTFLNENWKEILQELKPSITEALSASFKEIARRVFNKVPYDDIYLK